MKHLKTLSTGPTKQLQQTLAHGLILLAGLVCVNESHAWQTPTTNPTIVQRADSCVVLAADQSRTDGDALIWDFELTHPGTYTCLLYTSPSPRDGLLSRMPSSA